MTVSPNQIIIIIIIRQPEERTPGHQRSQVVRRGRLGRHIREKGKLPGNTDVNHVTHYIIRNIML